MKLASALWQFVFFPLMLWSARGAPPLVALHLPNAPSLPLHLYARQAVGGTGGTNGTALLTTTLSPHFQFVCILLLQVLPRLSKLLGPILRLYWLEISTSVSLWTQHRPTCGSRPRHARQPAAELFPLILCPILALPLFRWKTIRPHLMCHSLTEPVHIS